MISCRRSSSSGLFPCFWLRWDLSWFNPFAVPTFTDFSAGIAVSIFAYWGWDTVLTMSEETREDAEGCSTGKAATILILTLVALYVLIGVATVSYAGVGTGPTGLNNPVMRKMFSPCFLTR